MTKPRRSTPEQRQQAERIWEAAGDWLEENDQDAPSDERPTRPVDRHVEPGAGEEKKA